MSTVYISLGSNLGDKDKNLKQAIEFIMQHIGLVRQKSSIYSTEPWGYESFNNYLNQVVEVETVLDAQILMGELLRIETQMGRIRATSNYEDRTIDLDILFFDNLILDTAEIKVPHPRLHERLFILEPLNEVAENFIHPILNKSIKTLLGEAKTKTE